MKPDIGRRWFVELEGRAQGPFNQAQIQDLARLKRITPMTRIFAEGDVRWRLINEFDEFKIAPETSSSTQAREWVVLKRKTLKEAELSQNKFDQIGPFTLDEIFAQLATGDLSYNDYAWKKGFQRWAKLESLPDFNHTIKSPLPAVPDAPPVAIAFLNEPKLDLNAEEQNELDEFTVTNSRPLKLEPEAVPATAKPVGGTTKSVRAVEEELTKQVAQIEENSEIEAEHIILKPGLSRGRKVFRFALASLAACVVTVVAYDFVKENYGPIEIVENVVSTPAETPASAPPAPPAQQVADIPAVAGPATETNQVAQAPAQPLKAPTKTLPAKTAPVAPVYTKADYEMPKNPRIDFEVIRPDSVGQVVFSTNAPVNFPIEVKITGKSGQILRHASYSQTLKVQRQGGEVPSIQLAALKLPFGTYTLQAKFADQTKQKTFFYGVRDAKFQKSLEAHLKKVSTQQILEKKMVFYYLRDLEAFAKKLEIQRAKASKNSSGWKTAYKSWRKEVTKSGSKAFAAIKGTSGRDIAYPEIIAKAKELGQSLLKQGAELNGAIVQNRTLASSGMGPILSAIRDFKKEIALLSRY